MSKFVFANFRTTAYGSKVAIACDVLQYVNGELSEICHITSPNAIDLVARMAELEGDGIRFAEKSGGVPILVANQPPKRKNSRARSERKKPMPRTDTHKRTRTVKT